MRTSLIQGSADEIPLVDKSIDLVFTSPPYASQRTYGINAQRGASEWVEWMLTFPKITMMSTYSQYVPSSFDSLETLKARLVLRRNELCKSRDGLNLADKLRATP